MTTEIAVPRSVAMTTFVTENRHVVEALQDFFDASVDSRDVRTVQLAGGMSQVKVLIGLARENKVCLNVETVQSASRIVLSSEYSHQILVVDVDEPSEVIRRLIP